MKRKYRDLVPTNLGGKPREWVADEPNYGRLLDVAEKRTHRFALECIKPFTRTTMKEALAAAYIQGMSDTALLLNDS